MMTKINWDAFDFEKKKPTFSDGTPIPVAPGPLHYEPSLEVRQEMSSQEKISATLIELRDNLRALGYDTRIVNGDCFDVHQNGYVHYLSRAEAENLATRKEAGIDLLAHSERRGLNRWYDFHVQSRKDGEG